MSLHLQSTVWFFRPPSPFKTDTDVQATHLAFLLPKHTTLIAIASLVCN
ncbi:hypothetical protein [Chlorogloeopsis fritschii]|nr:hypothetical protein [Chlorogloeopsis fritschii]